VTLRKIMQVRKHATGVREIASLVEQANWLIANFDFLRRM
jgi:hypothetical protein